MKKISPVILLIIFLFFNQLLLMSQIIDVGDLNATIIHPSGKDCNDGNIDLHINNGFPPYEVEWLKWEPSQDIFITVKQKFGINGNDGQEDLNAMKEGRYLVKIFDALCGKASSRVNLTPGLNKLSLISKENNSICNTLPGNKPSACNGTLSVAVDVIGEYDIKWIGPDGFSANTTTISGLCTGEYMAIVSVSPNCSFFDNFKISCPDEVDGDTEKGQNVFGKSCFKLSPNPTNTDFIMISSCQENLSIDNIVISDLLGRKISEIRLDSNLKDNRVDISWLMPGIYLLTIVSNNQQWETLKMIKQ